MPQPIGTLLNNRYRIVRILGQGGMGAVYRASDEHLNIQVAVKENLFLTEEYGRQFKSEATILAGLRHPNLPHVSDYFALENQGQYLVMDYIEGEDLRERMERLGALPEREAILIGISICDALAYLHNRRPSVIHRDIKPGNIKVTADGQAVLVDFGLAKVMQGSQVTSTGARAMTPGYSPPEQYGTARTDFRSDIYSLGATLYAALTGVIPEDGLARMTGKAKLTPIRELAPKVNRKLADTIERALEVDPEDRFQTTDEFKRALVESGELANYYQERPTIAPPPSPTDGSENGGILDEAAPSKPLFGNRLSLRRRRARYKWAVIPGIAVLAVIAYLLFTLNPNFNRIVMAYLAASPTGTQAMTEVASANTVPPTHTAASPTEGISTTPGAAPVVEATETLASDVTPEPSQTMASAVDPTATPRGGGLGQIAFASDRGGIMQIYLMDVATKKARQITGQKDGACQPDWSPDGLRLVFISPCQKKQETYPGSNIYTINIDPAGNADQNSVAQITSSLEGDYDPAWSPDGNRIAFTSLRNGKSSIWVLKLDDLSTKNLSLPNSVDKQPAWAPSGLNLAFVRQTPYNQVWTMTDNGDYNVEFSLRGPVNSLWPAWSVDEQLIFYSQTSTDSQATVPTLFYRRLEERKTPIESRIPADAKVDIGPIAEVDPSPDGFWLVYESWPSGNNHDIYIMSINGSNQDRLTFDTGFDFGPVWRPVPALAQP